MVSHSFHFPFDYYTIICSLVIISRSLKKMELDFFKGLGSECLERVSGYWSIHISIKVSTTFLVYLCQEFRRSNFLSIFCCRFCIF